MKWTEHEKIRPVLFAPSVAHRGVGVVVERKGYTVRTRGDVDKLVPHEYECPVHGRFVREVLSSEVPDSVECTASETNWIEPAKWLAEGAMIRWSDCGVASHWCGSSRVGIGISAGEVTG